MKAYFIGIFIILNNLFFAQGFRARYNMPYAADNSTKAFFEISPGNYIGAGFSVDTSTGIQRTAINLVGLGAQGNLLWTKKYIGHKIEYINNGFVQRCFYKKDNFLYYAGCIRDTVGQQIGVFIKFDMNGDTLWQKIYRDSTSIDLIPQMVTSSVDGGFLITGFFQNWITGTRQGLILKTDKNGQELWRKKINKTGQNVQDGKAIVQDSASKKIAIVGYQYFTNADIHDYVLILDSVGTKKYQGHLCTTGAGGTALDLIQTQDKKLVMVGYQVYPQTIGGANCQKAFAVKFDINTPSVPIWKVDGLDTLGLYNVFICITELKNSDLLIGGLIDSVQSVWNGQSTLPNNTLTRLVVVDKDGHIKKKRYYNYKTNDAEVQNGQTIKSINICQDGSWLAAIEGVNYGVNPFFFIKYDSDGCDSTLEYCASLNQNTTGVVENKWSIQGIKIYPNPSKDFIVLESPVLENAELCFCDVSGREIKKIKLDQTSKISVEDLAEGIYLLTITRGSQKIYTTKFIKA